MRGLGKFMKSIVIIMFVLLITALSVVGFAYGFAQTSQKKVILPSGGAKALIDKSSVEWGQIKFSGGKVKAIYRITNTGTETLKLYGATTSCACTLGTITSNGKVTPPFGMHSPMSATVEVAPGVEAVVEALFDPAFHGPGGVGPISRTITVQTNDPANPTLNFQASGVVVK